MQREIKFRAWDKESKKMITCKDDVFEAPLRLTLHGTPVEIHNNGACGDPECCGDNENYSIHEHERYMLLQFTGLRDKNSREVYDGDVLDYLTTYGTVTRRHVFWSDKKGGWCIGDEGDAEGSLYHTVKLQEVVGNIYENPELL